MFAIFDTKTKTVIFSDDSKAKVLEVFNTVIPDPDNRGELYDGYKIVKIETCVIDTDEELYDEIIDLDKTFYEWFLPRLVCFRKHNTGYGGKYKNLKEWQEEIDKIIIALNVLTNNDPSLSYQDVEIAREMVNEWVGKNLGTLWL